MSFGSGVQWYNINGIATLLVMICYYFLFHGLYDKQYNSENYSN